jgi:alkaline phosphatase
MPWDTDSLHGRPLVRADSAHTREEILAAGRGPGAERLRGFIANTGLFEIMMAAYGWRENEKGASQ